MVITKDVLLIEEWNLIYVAPKSLLATPMGVARPPCTQNSFNLTLFLFTIFILKSFYEQALGEIKKGLRAPLCSITAV
jgi:hypothetical protein